MKGQLLCVPNSGNDHWRTSCEITHAPGCTLTCRGFLCFEFAAFSFPFCRSAFHLQRTVSWGHTAPCTLYAFFFCDTCIRQIAFHGRHGNQTRARSRSEQGRAHAAASAGTRHGGGYPPDAYATRDTALRLLQAPSNGVVSPGRAHRCCFSQYSPNTCCSNSVFALKQCAPAHKTHRHGPTGVAMACKRRTWRCSATVTAQAGRQAYRRRRRREPGVAHHMGYSRYSRRQAGVLEAEEARAEIAPGGK
jgi:hypothetical protein